MNQPLSFTGPVVSPLVRVRQEPSGMYAAEVVGLPEIQVAAASREEALTEVSRIVAQWFTSGPLVPLTLPSLPPAPKTPGWARDDPLEREFLEDLALLRQEDLEQTLSEDEQGTPGCSDTSSTPTI